MTQAEMDEKTADDISAFVRYSEGDKALMLVQLRAIVLRSLTAARLDERRRIQGGENSFKWDDFNDWLNAFIPRLSAREQGMASKAFEAARETINAPSDQSGEIDAN